ncbi:hypothetical protein [Taibaiella soli]|uniref:Uncharacterized protein n=1 Tax=Taibaiella soli TaxID=1649169 RepID=A0A2W2A8K1_9BACT|nr:hypothetical protein [Taibaiella soli]PZF71601.1 hypothetical protein DN068_16125 [Taibaiella soli]
MQQPKRNLLEEWNTEIKKRLSNLPSNPNKIAFAAQFEFIYTVFKNTFGLPFFNAEQAGSPITEQNWLHQLLVNIDHKSSTILLLDYALLIEYAKTLEPSFFKTIKELQRNLDNLRSYFFELFTFRLLDINNIPNNKKITEGNQEKEGTFTIGNIEYLFECRKLYMPGLIGLDVKKELTGHLSIKIRDELQPKLQSNVGMIFSIKFSKTVNNATKQKFKNKIDHFIKTFNQHNGLIHTIDCNDSDEEGTFSVVNYSEEKRLQMEHENTCDVRAYLIPPEASDAPGHYRYETSTTHTVDREAVLKQVISKLKEKRRQHALSNYENRVYIFDSESFPQFRMGLFQQASMLEDDILQKEMEDSSTDDILCLIVRDYTGQNPEIAIKVFCKPKFNDVKIILEQLKSNY